MTRDNASRKRAATGYEPRFDLDLEFGQQGELFVTDIAEAVASGMVEVKRDARWAYTGNVYVEYQCRRASGRYEPSGIASSDATVWAFVLGDTEVAVFLPAGLLKEFCREKFRAPNKHYYLREETSGSHPTKGILVPLKELMDWISARQKMLARGA